MGGGEESLNVWLVLQKAIDAYGIIEALPFGVHKVERFLGDLPVRERDKEGYSPRFWLERGIHDGEYDINEDGRLIALRILMLKARRQWVD